MREDGIRGDSIFANDKGLFLRVGNELYHSTPNATAPFWTKEISPDEHSSIAPGKSGIVANNYWGDKFEKNKRNEVYGRRYSTIFLSHEYAAFLKLPEVQFSSAPTEAFLKLLTVEKPGNMSMPEAGQGIWQSRMAYWWRPVREG